MDKKPEASDLAGIDAEEFARLQADARGGGHGQFALERDAEAERAELARREALDKAWREQEAYTRAVAEIRDKDPRRGARRAAAIALAFLIGIGVIGAVVYSYHAGQERMAEAQRAAAELRSRQEEDLAKLAAQASGAAGARPEAEPAASRAQAQVPATSGRAAEDEKKAADAARALALKTRDEERRRAQLAATSQAEAMAQAEERAKAVAATTVKEAARALPRPGTVFQDCTDCPRMVVIAAGEFTMGSPAAEPGRGMDEGPQRLVSIGQPFALGRSEVTVAEFRRFAEETGYKSEAERDARAQGCSGFIYAAPQSITSWRSPGLVQADSHPVLCVSWNDARAYAQWLSRKTGTRYRLPTEAEWEYAARAGGAGARHWGDDPVQACRFANVADQSRFQSWGFGQKHECTDGHYFTAPAGGYAPNRFGLYDMIGNVWEWTEDCWNASYAGAPADASAWTSGDCTQRVLRGGSWSTAPRFARSSTRHKNPSDYRDNLTGFRLARTLE